MSNIYLQLVFLQDFKYPFSYSSKKFLNLVTFINFEKSLLIIFFNNFKLS